MKSIRTPAIGDVRPFDLGALLGVGIALAMAWHESTRVGSWFFDPDDALRLVMVRDWLGGQAWGDVWQHRMQPGGTHMHWSRVDDLPVAGVVVLLRGLMGGDAAERIAMIAWPLGLVPLVTGIVAAAVGRSVPGVVAAVLTTFGGALLYRFMPGRIDHHAIMTTTTLLACCSLLFPASRAWGLSAGASTAVCLAVGFEDLGVLAALGTSAAALWALAREREYPLGYGLGLAGGMVVAEAVLVPDGARLDTACDCLSGAWVAAIGLAGCALALASHRGGNLPTARRVAVLCGIGATVVVVLMGGGGARCLAGPYPGLSATAQSYWLNQVNEMRDVVTVAHGGLGIYATQCLGIAVATTAMALVRLGGRRPTPREACYLAVWCVAVAFGLRYVRNSGLPVAMAAPLVGRGVARLASRRLPARAVAVALLMASAAPAILLAGEMRRDEVASEASAGSLDCQSRDAWAAAAAFPAGKAGAPVDLGPEVLAYTPHSVLAGGIHRASRGIDEERLLMSGSETEALEVVERDDLDYVFWCGWGGAPSPVVVTLGDKLRAGRFPEWLERVPGDGPVGIALVVKYKARKALAALRAPLPMAPTVRLGVKQGAPTNVRLP